VLGRPAEASGAPHRPSVEYPRPRRARRLYRRVNPSRAPSAIKPEEGTVETLTVLLDALFALGGVAALGFLAWGGWLVFIHSRGFVAEAEGRFEHRHRRRARRAARVTVDEGHSG
jgi:hypothetical protein